MTKSPGAQLAAMRRKETKQCPECGEMFTALVGRSEYCQRCANVIRVRRWREKQSGEQK